MGFLQGTDKPGGGLLKQRLKGQQFASLDPMGICKQGKVGENVPPSISQQEKYNPNAQSDFSILTLSNTG